MKFRLGLAMALGISAAYCNVANAEIKEPTIIKREQWKARPANTANMLKHGIPYRGLVVHHTQISQQGRWKNKTTAQKVFDIQGIHQSNRHKYRPEMVKDKKQWGDFAYHYFIDVDGKIASGRDPEYQGDSGTNYNMSGLLLIVLQGDFDVDRPTAAQLKSLDDLVAWLAAAHRLNDTQISDHNDHAGTKCPGKNLEKYMDALRKKTAATLKAG